VAIESGSVGWRAAGTGVVASYDSRPRTATKCVSPQLSSSLSSSKPSRAPSPSFDTVLSVEFVAKPNHAGQIRDSLSAAITTTFEGAPNFAGCAVMVSEQEQRLVTVLTFWHGVSSISLQPESVLCVSKLLDPYMDRKLRVQTMHSQIAILSAAVTAGDADIRHIHVA
jgi:hypothetical protein